MRVSVRVRVSDSAYVRSLEDAIDRVKAGDLTDVLILGRETGTGARVIYGPVIEPETVRIDDGDFG